MEQYITPTAYELLHKPHALERSHVFQRTESLSKFCHLLGAFAFVGLLAVYRIASDGQISANNLVGLTGPI
jgi:hypothetical protein